MGQELWTPYCGEPPLPEELLGRWNLDPVLLASLAAAAVFCILRTPRPWAGLAGLAVLAVVFVSPLCALSSALFTARTIHHVLLVALAAPLLAWAMPPSPGRALGAALVCQALVFWAWHAPAAYALALRDDGVYWLMQGSLLISAIWFWQAARSASALAASGALLVAMVAMGLLGAVLTFSQAPLYAPHLTSTFAFGLTPLEDQQAAGLIMWVPAAGVYLLAALAAVRDLLIPGRRESAL